MNGLLKERFSKPPIRMIFLEEYQKKNTFPPFFYSTKLCRYASYLYEFSIQR